MEEQIKMLISFYNIAAGTRFRHRTETTRKAVVEAIEASDGNMAEIRAFFKDEIAKAKREKREMPNISEVCDAYVLGKKQPKPTIPAEVGFTPNPDYKLADAAPAPAPTTAQAASGALDLLGQVVVEMLAKTKLSEVEAEVGKRMERKLEQYIYDNYGPIQRKVEIEFDGRKTEIEGVVHEKFDQVLKFVEAGEPVFLTGPAGSGKNVLCQQIAKTMGLDFYFTNAVTQEYKLTGFTDAMGIFHESQFYKAFKNGGLFMLDEMDASIPEVLIILNAAIANRYFDFPAPIGFVKAHENFRVVAAGNTFGIGADYDYVGRNQLDAASLDRFAQVRVDYDKHIEEACALGNKELLSFCRKFRAATKKAGIRTVVSYRAISRMAKLDSAMDAKDLLDSCLIKSLDAGDLDAIRNDVQGCGKYSMAFEQIAAERKAA